MLVPQEVPRKLTVEGVLPNTPAIIKQNDLLDGLEASFTSAMSTPVKGKDDSQEVAPKVFNVSLDLIESKKVFDLVSKRYSQTKHRQHVCSHLGIKKIYSVEIGNMLAEFGKKGAAVGNIQQLWHGTRSANLLSILKSGFIIPPSNASHCTGRMFGNGVYFSDQSTKALNYAYGYWSGGSVDNNCFMFLVDVAMGRSYTPKSYTDSFPKSGYDSTFAKAKFSGVQNNEMIVYKTYQINPVYLVEFAK